MASSLQSGDQIALSINPNLAFAHLLLGLLKVSKGLAAVEQSAHPPATT
jgi:hypothetical protein